MRVGVIGAGLIGCRRVAVAHEAGDTVVIVADTVLDRATSAASQCGARPVADAQEVIASDVDAVIVATPPKFATPAVIAAATQRRHILCEKPLGRSAGEAAAMLSAASHAGVVLKTGFNHRHHPAIQRAHQLLRAGEIGEPSFVRAVYGHGGRPGYDQEWRADPELAGGGELLDQGVHVIDLARWFLGDFVETTGYLGRYFWKVEPLEDNAFVLLRTAFGSTAALHTSWTQWKNRFTFEVYGRDGYLTVEGLGGSYGAERLTVGRRRPESGPPQERIEEFPGVDRSWHDEWDEFKSAIREGREPLGSGRDGLEAMRVVEAIYRQAGRQRQVGQEGRVG